MGYRYHKFIRLERMGAFFMEGKCIIGLEIGGTNSRIGAVTLDGSLIDSRISDSKIFAQGTPETAIADLAGYIKNYIEERNISEIQAIAVAFPGTIDSKRQILYSASNLGENAKCRYDGMNIPQGLCRYFREPVFLGKDTDYILYNDIKELGIDTEEMVAGIYFGTGIGSSFYYRKETIYGSDGVAGEIGHLPISDHDRKCTCNEHQGCCETVASGWRLIQVRDEYFPDTPVNQMFVRHRDEAPLREFVDYIARILALTGNLLNCAYTIVGGGVINIPEFPREQLLENTLQMLRHPYPRDTYKLLFSPGGQNAGILGAAQFLFRKLGIDKREGKP
jgi:allose kinase